ncbi:MAG: sporulation peptidase YabG [Bacillota bacterium]
MSNLRIGDLVARKSYNYDILFKVVDIIESPGRPAVAVLKGVSLRIVADSPEDDLYKMPLNKADDYSKTFNKKIDKTIKRIMRERKDGIGINYVRSLPDHLKGGTPFGKAGNVLHIDGDGEYLDVCLKTYKQLEIEAIGKKISEAEQPRVIGDLLREFNPDILVVTGHDALLKGYKDFTNVDNYRSSKYFIESVKEARRYEPNMDDLVIFAGACQSHYEAILQAGANFASSPHRILVE